MWVQGVSVMSRGIDWKDQLESRAAHKRREEDLGRIRFFLHLVQAHVDKDRDRALIKLARAELARSPHVTKSQAHSSRDNAWKVVPHASFAAITFGWDSGGYRKERRRQGERRREARWKMRQIMSQMRL